MAKHHTIDPASDFLPHAPVRKWVRPFVRFLAIESASGVVLLICTVIALILANSSAADAVDHFWHTHVGVYFGDWKFDLSFAHWINDALMAIFFFVVGLEIKRELVDGELREWRKAALPVMAAAGGMIVPAAIYLALQYGRPGEGGWGIPMATDIAFVVGFLALLGKRVPLGLKILLLALAIVDDIGAVLVIAVFYTSDIVWSALGFAAGGFVITTILNRIGVRTVPIYVVVGAGIWLAFLVSGVHPTVAGVMLGLLTPASAWVGEARLTDVIRHARDRMENPREWHDAPDRVFVLDQLRVAARESSSPLERLETGLHPWVAFGIMPVFALANAGVRIDPAVATDAVAMAVAAGLVLGKPIGIVAFSWIAVRLGIAELPTGVNWKAMIGAGCLAGIGFTMSLFIAGLAFEEEPTLLAAAKIGTLGGSVISAVLGFTLLIMSLRPEKQRAASSTPG
jgi:NhaA family Na+:H+ antiporter